MAGLIPAVLFRHVASTANRRSYRRRPRIDPAPAIIRRHAIAKLVGSGTGSGAIANPPVKSDGEPTGPTSFPLKIPPVVRFTW